MWTEFWDMHSGGRLKEKQHYIYIEAPEDEAKVIFYNRFGHNPERVTCTCCGQDYSISESETLEEATAYQRGCDWSNAEGRYVEAPRAGAFAKAYQTIAEFEAREDVLVIRGDDIKPGEREGDVPEQGYVWV